MSIAPQAIQDLLDELEASRASRKRAWENLQEIRWVLKDSTGVELPPAARKTIDLEGRLVKDGVRKALKNRQNALTDLVHAIRECRKVAEKQPLRLQGSDYAHAVQELNKAIDRADAVLRSGLDVSRSP
jgi:soluble cytochrome b562